ncbi:AraC family transcriptional regulator [Fibrisoma montanum]|uniref:AraC family transcriptional regulator n=1 Tax=Fibrisoma montanum TaxID=2305895 RepID=A0A418MES8_9BACT|nr:AraC family transcriptional regulator [Fibrisoma montanum]RIV25312.1 AraC family transcriptional regulator [Fibrisoma montanum]
MLPLIQAITYLYLAGALQGFCLAVLIGLKKNSNRVANRLLALLVFLFSYNTLYYFLSYHQLLQHYPHLYKTSSGVFLLFGPLVYLYVWYALQSQTSFQWKHLVHFLPWLGLMAVVLPILVQSAAVKQQMILTESQQHGLLPANPYFLISDVLMTGLLMYYGYRMRQFARHTTRDQAAVLNRILIFFTVFAVSTIIYRVGVTLGMGYYNLFGHTTRVLFTLAVYALAYTAFQYPDGLSPKTKPQKYRKSPLSESASQSLADKINQYVTDQKPYLLPDFGLDQLAATLELPAQYVSQVINEQFGQSFPDFINARRIDEAKRLLKGDEKITAIALDCGFNNRVTFNTAFKKFTGQTPSEYRLQRAELAKNV